MNLTLNVHNLDHLTGLFGRWARADDGRIGRVSPDPMGSGKPVVKFYGGKYVRPRGALTLVSPPKVCTARGKGQ